MKTGQSLTASLFRRRGIAPGYLSACLVVAVGCGQRMGAKGPCDDLVYTEQGLEREEYVPCAGEMVATMDRIRPLLEASLAGAEQWVARFRIFTTPGTMGVRDAERVGKQPSDFQLFIENPFPQGEQARRIAIRLR